jgi:5-methylthioadenosine/S-adenosylhomocysteine deaminase
MLFADIAYLNSEFEISHGYVGVTNGRISYLSVVAPDPKTVASFGETINGKGKLLIPGLYNTHTHLPMTLLRGYAEGLSLQSWLNDRIFPFEARINEERAYPATLLGIAEMLRFGIVSFTDMYFFSDARIRAIRESGIKANICDGVMVFDQETRYEDTASYAQNIKLVREHHDTLDGRLRIDLNVHSEYISNPHVVRAVGDLASELGVNTHIHASETKTEHQECKQRRSGLTPIQYFDSLEFFRMPCTAAHCVYAEPEDIQIMRERNVTVAANPASNMKLASGFAPVPQMLAAGVNVALGTDGVASNNNHNLFKELYLLATIYKGASADPTVISPAEALRAATFAGAKSQGRDDCGVIALGKRADLVLLNTNVPWMQPVHDQLNNLVYSAMGTDVVLTMVDGQVLYRDGEYPTIDVEKVAAQTQKAACEIKGELNL